MQEFVRSLVTRLGDTFDPAAAGATAAALLANLLVAGAVLLAVAVLWRIIHATLRRVLERTRVDATATAFIVTTLKYTVLVFGALFALDAVGIDTTKVFASLGIAGLTIGFAARDALSNIISGILIFWDRPFVIGDLIEIDGHYGRVEAITLRSTRVVTVDGKMLAVPNTDVINSTVASYTNFPHLRLDIGVTIGMEENIDHVRGLLLDLVLEADTYMADPSPRVVVARLGDYSNEVQLQVWIHDERRHIEERFRLRENVFNALLSAGVDMPLETFSITPLEVRQAAGAGG
jgi:small conductance mechanosensitive channel